MESKAIIDSNATIDNVVFDFNEDPAASWALCCQTGDCEEQYRQLAVTGVACGVDGETVR